MFLTEVKIIRPRERVYIFLTQRQRLASRNATIQPQQKMHKSIRSYPPVLPVSFRH